MGSQVRSYISTTMFFVKEKPEWMKIAEEKQKQQQEEKAKKAQTEKK